MDNNKIKKLIIYCIFGTEKAEEKIKENLEKKGIDCEIIIVNKLKSGPFDELMGKAVKLFGVKVNQDIIPVFREFNMPKKSIFPDQLLDDPKKAISLFIRKKELPKRKI